MFGMSEEKVTRVFWIAVVILGILVVMSSMGCAVPEILGSAKAEIAGADPDTVSSVVSSAVGGVIETVAPGLSPLWLALAPLLFKRFRKHAKQAGQSLLPTDGKVDLGAGVDSMMKAVGLRSGEDK